VSDPIHPLASLQSPVFLLNSRLGLFTAACRSRHPLSLSYGANLPSSFTMVLSSTLGSSPRLPVSDCGTGTYQLKLRGFSREQSYAYFHWPKPPFVSCFRINEDPDLPKSSPYALSPTPTVGQVSLSPSPLRTDTWYMNFRHVFHRLRLFGLGLGPDLPWED
jgi:hypothetical protein